MTLDPGSKLSHYEILSPLGAGGMGEVWRAKDAKLGREVAIKVLPDEFTRDAERLARFEREARVLASLEHARVASIYGIEEAGGTRFIVMQIAEGEDLSDRLRRGPVPPDEAIAIARQIAEALEAAHEKGIVHRDLKPGNIKVDEEGNVTILDFGLAKALESEPGDVDLTNSPTMVKAATHAGMILGTAAYMSPEQAAGKKVDKRTDIWAFGVVLYEMLTGERLFRGETVSELLAAVLRDEPDLERLPAGVPRSVRRVTARCLTRNPKKRLRDIGEARIALEAREESSDDALAPSPAPAPASRLAILLPWGLAIVATVIGLWVAFRPGAAGQATPSKAALTAFGVAMPDGYVLRQDETPVIDLSRDGRTLVFVAEGKNGRTLFVRHFDRTVLSTIDGTSGAQNPFLSPDAGSVGFVSGGKIRKVAVDGGTPVTLAPVFAYRGAVWGPDGWIVYTKGYADPLYKVRDTGGTPEQVTTLDATKGERSHRWPAYSPDGRWVAFTVGDSRNPSYYDDSRIDAVNMETGERTTVYEGAMFARFAANDRLLLQRGATLFAVDVDPATLAVTSTPRTLIDDVGKEASSGAGYFAASLTDAMAYVPSQAIPDEKSLVLVGEDGSEETLPLDPKAFWHPRLSPDGRRLAFAVGSLGGGGGIDSDLWLYDTEAKHTSRLTFQPGRQIPLWSPDGKRIIYSSANSETTRLYVRRSDGGGAEETIDGISNEVGFADAFTPDGESLIVTTVNSIKMLQAPVTGGGSSMLFDDPGAQWGASFSPDGRFLAYVSTETGVDEIFVRPWPIEGGKWQVSVEGGQFPVWSRDGRRLFYVSDGVVYGCDVSADGGAFRASAPREVVRGPYELRTAPVRNFDLGPDGRFVFVRLRTDVVAPRQLEVLLGWSAGLEKR